MNRFAFLTLYRSLTRHKLYAALNVGGLAVGIAVFLVLGLYVKFETSFERWLPGHDQIYLVQSRWTPNGAPPFVLDYTMGGLLEHLHQDFSDTYGTRVKEMTSSVIVNGTATSDQVDLVDPSFFGVFHLPVVEGDAAPALKDPSNLLLSQASAKKYFPAGGAVGQQMTIAVAGTPRTYRVAAILKDSPRNSDLKWDFVTKLIPDQLENKGWYRYGSSTLQTYLRFATPAAAAAYAQRLPSLVNRRGKEIDKNPSKYLTIPLLPLADVHLAPAGSKLTVTTLGLVGLLTLLIAVINYVNLATARAGLRAREVAMRKVLGGSRAMLIRQFLGEAVVTAAIAAIVGLALAELALPLVNAAGGSALSIDYLTTVPLLIGIAVLVGVGAGLYPAMVLSRFPAASVLASARTPGGGRTGAKLREGLVIAQFALAIAFLIGTGVLFAQTAHVRDTDLGFRREGLIVVPGFELRDISDAQRAAVMAAYRALPMTVSATIANTAPADTSYQNSSTTYRRGQDAGSGPSLTEVTTGSDWFATYSARLVAGRLLDTQHRGDDTGPNRHNPANVVLNRSAVAALGFASPAAALGQPIEMSDTGNVTYPRTVVGVIDDMRFYSPRKKVGGVMYEYQSTPLVSTVATVRYRGDQQAALDALRDTWHQLAPQVPFSAKTIDQNLAPYYKADDHAARLFAIGAVLAVLIGCVGLWGLASFNTQRRIKEVGIRKTLGASSADIVKLLVGQFLRPVLIANVVAWPLAFFAMRTWLAGFDDRIALSPLYFVAATLVALTIALLTVLAQSLRAARATPAWALRHE